MAIQIVFPLFVFIVLIFILVLWYVQNIRRPKNFPPGPDWLPVVGNFPILKRLCAELGGQYKALWHLGKLYDSEIVGLRLGTELTICVMGHRLVRHVLIHDEFEGRPDNFFIRLRCMGKRRGITCIDGPIWHDQRAFVVRHLRQLGYGKNTMEAMVQDEIIQVLKFLEQNSSKNIEFEPLFAPSVINVLWTLTTGSKLARDDVQLSQLLSLFRTRSKAFDMAGGTLNQMPWLRYIVPEKIGYNLLVRLNDNLKVFFAQTIQEHHDAWYPECQDDFIYSFITEMKKNEDKIFTDEQLIMICLDLFIAGSTTTSSTLNFIFLGMLLNPDIQEKAAHYLNKEIPSDRPLTYSDRLKVPYLEAIIMESERIFSVVPIIGPRRVMRDTEIDNYHIPKNTTVLINAYSVHHDKEYWGDPHVFRPERFINEEGKLLSGERVLHFGLGRRRCLGELLARQFIFLFFTSILRKYKISPVPGTQIPSTIPRPGLTLSPQSYKVRLELRH